MQDPARAALIEAFTLAWTEKDVAALMDLMAEDCTFRSSVGPEPGASFVGRDEVRRGFELYLGGSSDLPAPESKTAPMLVSRDFAVTRWTTYLPQPDGSTVQVHACDIFEFDGDRIAVKDTYRKVAGQLPPG
jgi:ketosteroid isomerase-like protein